MKVKKALDDYLESVILSEDAKKFLIAREIFRGIHCRHLYEAVIPVVVLGVSAPVLFGIKIGVTRSKILLKGFVALLSISTLLMVYFLVGDFWRRRTEKLLDVSAVQLGINYAQGGVEFYDKALQRHVSLRELMPDGKKLYNLKGESFPSLFREKHVPTSKRRDYCKAILAESK